MQMRRPETTISGVRDRGWPTRTDRHRTANGDGPSRWHIQAGTAIDVDQKQQTTH